MFEQSVLAGGGWARRTRCVVAISLLVQTLVVTAFVVVPLLWPEVLPVVSGAPRMTSIALRRPDPPRVLPVHTVTMRETNATAVHVPSETAATSVTTMRGAGRITRGSLASPAGDVVPLLALGGGGMGTGSLLGTGVGASSPGPAVVAASPRVTGPARISSGVSAGLLLAPIQPVYPAIAKAAHLEGTVVLTATIDRSGRITGLVVVSGPDMLRNSALQAVQAARYRPFYLNGETTEVVTTVSVVFRMNG